MIDQILEAIPKIYILDLIPLDYALHFTVGAGLTIFMLGKLKWSLKKTFWVIFSLTIAKEIRDAQTLESPWSEHFFDTSLSLLYFLVIVLFRKYVIKNINSNEDA